MTGRSKEGCLFGGGRSSVIISGCPPSPFTRKEEEEEEEEEQSPISRRRRTLIVPATVSPRRRASPGPIIPVGGVRILVPTTTRMSAVRIVAVAAPSGWRVRVVQGRACGAWGRWRTVAAITRIVSVTGWGTAAVVVATGAVATRGRWATAVVSVRWRIAAAPTERWGGAGAVAIIAGNLILCLYKTYLVVESVEKSIRGTTYVSHAANAGSFKILIVQFINGNLQISSGLKLHESSAVSHEMTMIS